MRKYSIKYPFSEENSNFGVITANPHVGIDLTEWEHNINGQIQTLDFN